MMSDLNSTSSMEERIELLRGMPFSRQVSPDVLDRLARIAELQAFEARQVMVRQGEPAQAIYLIVSGQVTLEVCAAGMGCKQLLTVQEGEWLGWSAILDPIHWTATARARVATTAMRLDGASLRQLCDDDPTFGYALMRSLALTLSKRLNATRLQLMDVYGSLLPASVDTAVAAMNSGGDRIE